MTCRSWCNQERDWVGVAKELDTGHTPLQCMRFYERTCKIDNINTQEWHADEDQRLLEGMHMHSSNWLLVAEHVESRTHLQCRQRSVTRHLGPCLLKGCRRLTHAPAVVVVLCDLFQVRHPDGESAAAAVDARGGHASGHGHSRLRRPQGRAAGAGAAEEEGCLLVAGGGQVHGQPRRHALQVSESGHCW